MDNLLAICDYETTYAYKLAEYLRKKKVFPFQVMPFNDLEKLFDFCRENPVQVLLLAQDMKEELPKNLQTEQIIYLCQEQKNNGEKEDFIYKYQSGDAIMKKIMELYSENKGRKNMLPHPIGKKGMEIIGIYSPIGRCLQTSFSLILGQLLAQDKRCLYLNFEAYSGFSRLLEREFSHDFMDLMYFLKAGNDRFVYKLASMVESIGNLDFIPPAVSFPDILEMDGEKWQLLLDELWKNSDYEVLIMDLSDHVRGLFQILERCDRIYTITKPDGMALAKIEQYEMLLASMKKENILKKTVTCKIPVFKQVPYRTIHLPHSQLANYVRNLLREQKET